MLVPINFRLNTEEVQYIVEHSGASVLLVDPELDEALGGVTAKERIVLDGSPTGRRSLRPRRRTAARRRCRGSPTRTPPPASTTPAARRPGPRACSSTHRNCWLNATVFGWHDRRVTDRDVYLHTLPMFHCNGWGMPYAVTGMGCPQVVLRKVDGEEILRRIEAHGVTLLCGAPAVVAAVLDAGQPAPRRGARRSRAGAGSASSSPGPRRPRR